MKIIRSQRDAVTAKALDGERTKYPTTTTGLVLDVSPVGNAKTWYVRYSIGAGRAGRKQRWHPLGSLHQLSFGEAVRGGNAIRVAARQGIDPQAAKHRAKNADTFGDLFAGWLNGHAKLKKRTWNQDKQRFDNLLAGRLGAVALPNLTRLRIVTALDEISNSVSGFQANRCQEIVSSVCNWAVDEGKLESSPATRIRKRIREPKRDRCMTDRELKLLWNADLPRPQLLSVRLLALLGARESEVCGMQERELGCGGWTIPKERMKEEKAHTFPLTHLARSYAEELVRLGPPHPKSVSHIPRDLSGHPGDVGHAELCDCRLSKPDPMSESDKLRKPHSWCWKIHTLRHTAKTRWGSMRWTLLDPLGEGRPDIVHLGVPRSLSHRITAHSVGIGAGDGYDHGDYMAERRAILAAWENELLRIVGT